MPRRRDACARARAGHRRLYRELHLQLRQVHRPLPGVIGHPNTLSALEGGEGVSPQKTEPLVFLNYTQAELDAAYNQAAYQANIQQLRDRWISNSERARARVGPPERRAYGPSEIERLDIFRTETA